MYFGSWMLTNRNLFVSHTLVCSVHIYLFHPASRQTYREIFKPLTMTVARPMSRVYAHAIDERICRSTVNTISSVIISKIIFCWTTSHGTTSYVITFSEALLNNLLWNDLSPVVG